MLFVGRYRVPSKECKFPLIVIFVKFSPFNIQPGFYVGLVQKYTREHLHTCYQKSIPGVTVYLDSPILVHSSTF
jgi:uncharacterized protein YneR